jgi:adenosylhomocysteine nucleosidase
MQEKIIGIMGAMPEEIDSVVQLLDNAEQSAAGGRIYFTGRINGIKAVVVISGWGKVAAAATVSALIHKFGISELIFTGVAGALSEHLQIGDIVIGNRLLQHDMDARPFIPRYEIPLLKKTFFECPPSRLSIATAAVQQLLEDNHLHTLIAKEALLEFNITCPKVYIGDIASGDQFFADAKRKQQLLQDLPGILCVEMEGAAVAQVCYENDIPFTIIRTISDAADEQSHIDFAAFIRKIAGNYSVGLINTIFKQLQ